ncbi:hypothetical protein SDRG_00369 [Saprolegnia diclina VS20]|uniref:BROMI C-terminal Rab TBC-like domain-containing protein n=1 Tax=Saprolegnia diclina (strain VS20) TaxID=1156394 RepID=T0R6T6_SAPDV|nr:hypothetical protein SDRG_00369 [Saprolegnia diclina VS20]EQC42641.1 hypothetical protein SDRG_00369 [Saprolegnia diclina VS20]|eukprot:XP_008604064.1 hypothetical protein SDRG_00369 [Saprolegnia diclina VS20]
MADDACSSLREVLGVVLRSVLPNKTLDDDESVEEALGRLRRALQALPQADASVFWHLAHVAQLKEMLHEHVAEAIETYVDDAMAKDPDWMLVTPNASPLDAVVDAMILSKGPNVHQLQTRLHDAVASQVAAIMDELRDRGPLHDHFAASASALDARVQAVPSIHGANDNVLRLDSVSNDDADDGDSNVLWTDGFDDEDDSHAPQLTAGDLYVLLDRMALPSSKARLDAFAQLVAVPVDALLELGDASVDAVTRRLVSFCLDKDDVTSIRTITLLHALFQGTQRDSAAQCRLYAVLVETLLHSTPRPALFLRKPSISSPTPSQSPQRGLLRMLRYVHHLLQVLPNEWVYAPPDVRARALLMTAQLLGPWDIPGSSSLTEQQSLSGSTADYIPMASILACIDMQATWFTRWHLTCPWKGQWLHLLHECHVIIHLVERLVHGHTAVELWRKFSRHTMSPAGVTYRRRSLSRATLVPSSSRVALPSHVALDSPSPLPQWYTILMQKTMVQGVHMLLELLPLSSVQAAFPLRIEKTEHRGGSTPLPMRLSPDPATNQLLFTTCSPARPSSSKTDNVEYDAVCLHLTLVCVAQLWRSDAGCAAVGASPLDTMHEALIPKLLHLVRRQHAAPFYDLLLHVLVHIRRLEHERPVDIGSIAFPYAALATEDAKALVLTYTKHVVVHRDHPRIKTLVQQLVSSAIDGLVSLPPTSDTAQHIVALLADPTPVLGEVHAQIAAACRHSLLWLECFADCTDWLAILRDACPTLSTRVRDCILRDLTATARGLMLGYPLLLAFPLDLAPLWATRDMESLMQMMSIPTMAAAFLHKSPTLSATFEHRVDALVSHVDGFEALVDGGVDAPIELRDTVVDLVNLALLFRTPYAATDLGRSPWWRCWTVEARAGDTSHVAQLLLVDALVHSSPAGAHAVAMHGAAALWRCGCPDDVPCAIDPISWHQHRIQQRLECITSSRMAPDVLAPICAQVNPARPPTPGSLRPLEAQFLHLQYAMRNASNHLDFKAIGGLYWHLVDDMGSVLDDAPLTAWLGDVLLELVIGAKSKLALPYPGGAPMPSIEPASEAWLPRINRWLKHRSQSIGLDPLPCTSLLPPTLSALGREACDPFVWSLLVMLSPRHSVDEVLSCLVALRGAGPSLFLWPARAIADATFAGCHVPLFHVASIVEGLAATECPAVMTTLARLHLPLTTLLLRWQLHGLWSVLPWRHVMVFINFVGVYGMDYIPLLTLVLLRELQPSLMTASTAAHVLDAAIPGFAWGAHRAWIERLHSVYHDVIKTGMRRLYL